MRAFTRLRCAEAAWIRRRCAPGDILFFDNTYDRNGDRRWNDELTHAAIVVEVLANGTVTYVHHNYRVGIVAEKLHLRRPADPAFNSAMRMRAHRYRAADPWLSGQLLREAGRLTRTGEGLVQSTPDRIQ